MKVFWSNCLIEALKHKCKSPSSTCMKFIWTGWHFHVMWHDKRQSKICHFTHKSLPGWHSDLFFKGRVENMSISAFNLYCSRIGREDLQVSIP